MHNSLAQKLLFIYNADSAPQNRLVDGLHKILSPSTYTCSLCGITHGAFQEKKAWRNYREKATVPMDFLHRDAFLRTYKSKFGHKFTFPVVLVESGNGLEILIQTAELNTIGSVEELIRLVDERSGSEN